jgi:hypothetical protein
LNPAQWEDKGYAITSAPCAGSSEVTSMPVFNLLLPSILLLACETVEEEKGPSNLPPYSPIIDIEPGEADTTTDLQVVQLEPMPYDPEGEDVSIRFEWHMDGSDQGIDSDTIAAGSTEKGQVWTVYAFSNDGVLDSAPSSRTIAIQNAKPIITDYSASPEAPTTSDDLVVSASSEDSDGDEVAISYSWSMDGDDMEEHTEDTLPAAATSKGEFWQVIVTPNDGEEDGEVQTAGFTILNTPPILDSVDLIPTEAYESSVIEPVIAYTDLDGDELSYTYVWMKNGQEIADATDSTLGSEHFNKGDNISVTIVGNDGEDSDGDGLPDGDDSNPLTSDFLSILNAPPSITAVEITPANGVAGDPASVNDELTCSASGEEDLDGDAVTLSYRWLVGTDEVGTEAVLPASTVNKGDELVCEVTPSDDDGGIGTALTAAVTISNSAPVINSVSFAPAAPNTDTTLTVDYDVVDADGDVLVETFSWQLNTIPHSSVANNMSSADFARGDVVAVSVFVNDGEVDSNTVEAEVTIGNALPVLDTTDIDADGLRTYLNVDEDGDFAWTIESDTDIVCHADATDSDPGDTISYSFSWTLDGIAWTGEAAQTTNAGDTVPAASVVPGEWRCTVTPRDSFDEDADGNGEQGDAIVLTVNVANTAPVLDADPSVSGSVSETGAYAGIDDLVCSASATDAEGHEVAIAYSWSETTVDADSGAEVSTPLDGEETDTLAAPVEGSTYTCTATPWDGWESGEPATSAGIEIEGSAAVRFVHLAENAGDSDAYQSGGEIPLAAGLVFPSAADYTHIPAVDESSFIFNVADGDPLDDNDGIAITGNTELTAGAMYTVVLFETNDGSFDSDIIVEDSTPADGNFIVRYYHASHSADSADIYVDDVLADSLTGIAIAESANGEYPALGDDGVAAASYAICVDADPDPSTCEAEATLEDVEAGSTWTLFIASDAGTTKLFLLGEDGGLVDITVE